MIIRYLDPYNVGALRIGRRFHRLPSKGYCKGYYKDSRFGALIIGTGFWSPVYFIFHKEPQTSIGNY